MKARSLLLYIASAVLAAPGPPPQSNGNEASAPVVFRYPPASRDYLWTMIACDESEERYVASLYDAFLRAVDRKELSKEEFQIPTHFAVHSGPYYIFERGYYVTQNNLKGFSLAIPVECMASKGGMISPSCDLVVADWDAKQGLQLLTLKRKEPNKALEPTPGTVTPRAKDPNLK